MIHIVGEQNTPEYAAALALREMIVRAWPGTVDNQAHDVKIVVGAKCHGQDVRDIDILLLASFGPGLEYTPFLSFDVNGRRYTPRSVGVRSLCLVVEVKDHSPESVRFSGTSAEVHYQGKWHDASWQNERQIYAVKNYLKSQGVHPPYVTGLLWLRNVPNTTLPPRPHPILGAPITWELVLNVVAQLAPPRLEGERWTLAAGHDPLAFVRVAEVFTKTLIPTRLDRQRMERINKQTATLSAVEHGIGEKLVIFRGRGGTGKTMRLLQLANRLCDEQGARILILTYNKALVADIRRLLTILGIGDDITGQAIHIQTVHSFVHVVLKGLEIVDPSMDFLRDYEALKDQSLEYLRTGALVAADVEGMVAANVEAFRWDYVFVDEGQDWPTNERDLLLMLYPHTRIVVADGIEQLIRRYAPADWRGAVKPNERRIVPLQISLRMKAGLARFVSAMARHMGLLSMSWEPNEEIPGGRVIIVDGPYLSDRSLHDQLLKDNANDGNAPVDMLFCVPPQLVLHRQDGSPSQSVAAVRFADWGFPTWDGASANDRDTYPTQVDQLRIVQYESCRGLEGWIVVNLGLDTFYDTKYAGFQDLPDTSIEQVPGAFQGDTLPAQQFAARWLCMPLTRAMDTLVIQLDREYSPLRYAIEAATKECGDYVQWIRTVSTGPQAMTAI